MKARLRRLSGAVFRPVAVAFDPRLAGLEQRLSDRIDRVEHSVAADVEAVAEFYALSSRTLAALEQQLARLEDRLNAGDDAPGL